MNWMQHKGQDHGKNIDEETIKNAFKTITWTALENDICDTRQQPHRKTT